MMNRIRYKTVAGSLVSKQMFRTAEGTEVWVSIDLASNTVRVERVDNAPALYQGVGSSLANAKIKAKNALLLMGVAFTKESRKSSVGRTLALSVDGEPSLNG